MKEYVVQLLVYIIHREVLVIFVMFEVEFVAAAVVPEVSPVNKAIISLI